MTQKTFLLLFLICSVSCSYLPEPYEEEANLILEENADYILLTSSTINKNKSGILFYPGGLVDPHAYITALKKFVIEDDRTVVIVKVTSNLAILNTQKASAVKDELTDINRWVIGGHSLGGSVACINIFKQPDDFDALFLLASYSADDISDNDIPMLSITASNDDVLNQDKFNENKVNLSEEVTVTSPAEISNESTSGTTIYHEIEGGNHAQFGNYGNQEGDGNASISADAQQVLVVDMLRKFLLSNNL